MTPSSEFRIGARIVAEVMLPIAGLRKLRSDSRRLLPTWYLEVGQGGVASDGIASSQPDSGADGERRSRAPQSVVTGNHRMSDPGAGRRPKRRWPIVQAEPSEVAGRACLNFHRKNFDSAKAMPSAIATP